MKRHGIHSVFVAFVFLAFFTACGNSDDESSVDGDNTPDGDGVDGDVGDGDEIDGDAVDGDEPEDGDESDGDAVDGDEPVDGDAEAEPSPLCTPLAFDMKANDSGQVFITLTDMQTHLEDITDYDIVFARVHGQGPTAYLGADVTALNAGNATAFGDYIEAPTDGYATDGGEELIIGHSWQDGGSGPDGYDCTGNVYVLKLADGSYAKIAITSAQNGQVSADAFHQADGSRNLQCRFE